MTFPSPVCHCSHQKCSPPTQNIVHPESPWTKDTPGRRDFLRLDARTFHFLCADTHTQTHMDARRRRHRRTLADECRRMQNFSAAFYVQAIICLGLKLSLSFTYLWVVDCVYRVDNFCWVDKMSSVHVVSFCNLIGTARPRQRKFSHGCYQALSSLCLLRREPGNKATSLLCTLYAPVHYTALCNTTHNTQLSRATPALQVIWPRVMSYHVSPLRNTPMERSVMEHTFAFHVSTSLVLNIAFSINLWTYECGQHLQKI